jgi:hypothetical protein
MMNCISEHRRLVGEVKKVASTMELLDFAKETVKLFDTAIMMARLSWGSSKDRDDIFRFQELFWRALNGDIDDGSD